MLSILKKYHEITGQFLVKEGLVDTSFIGLDFTPIAANTPQNNPKSFLSNKFNPNHQPKADSDCKLGVHTASLFFLFFLKYIPWAKIISPNPFISIISCPYFSNGIFCR